METDIILEGFLEAERVHRVRYTEFIGNGDSSVHPTLITPHAQCERGKVIEVGVHIYVYMFVDQKKI